VKIFTALVVCILTSSAAALAQLQRAPNLSTQEEVRQSYLEQRADSQIPAKAAFVDDQGRAVHLSDYLGKTPVLLVLGYFTCPDLCPMAFLHLTEELNGIAPVAGRDFQFVVISFDPRDTPALAAGHKITCQRAYKWPVRSDGFHFLVGTQDSIDAVAQAIGFHYTYDQRQQKFVHPTGVMVLTPAGRFSHNFFGIDAAPTDVESAIHDAAAGRTTRVDQVNQQYCVDYDPTLSVRGRRVTRILQAVCISFAALLFGYIGIKISHDIRHPPNRPRSASRLQEVES
jgi:protein SCO1/2